MKEIIFWASILSILYSIYKRTGTPLPKGKWIRKYTATEPLALGNAVESKQGLNSKSKEVASESDRNGADIRFCSSNLSKAVNSQSDS